MHCLSWIHIPWLFFPRKVILKGATQSPHPFGIAVFENHVFFTDWTKMAVMRANRFSDNNPALLYRTANRPGHVVVSHPVLQPIGEDTSLGGKRALPFLFWKPSLFFTFKKNSPLRWKNIHLMKWLTCYVLQWRIPAVDTTVAVNTFVSWVTAQTMVVWATAASVAMVMIFILTFEPVKVSLHWLYRRENSDLQP